MAGRPAARHCYKNYKISLDFYLDNAIVEPGMVGTSHEVPRRPAHSPPLRQRTGREGRGKGTEEHHVHIFACRACTAILGCKSPAQPDGGEGLAERQGLPATVALKGAPSKEASR